MRATRKPRSKNMPRGFLRLIVGVGVLHRHRRK